MIEGSSRGVLHKTQRRSGIGLGIAINEESGLFGGSKAGGQIHRSCCLAHSTLLVRDRDNSSQTTPVSENLAKVTHGCKKFHVEQHLAVEICFRRAECSMRNNSYFLSSGWRGLVPRGTKAEHICTPFSLDCPT